MRELFLIFISFIFLTSCWEKKETVKKNHFLTIQTCDGKLLLQSMCQTKPHFYYDTKNLIWTDKNGDSFTQHISIDMTYNIKTTYEKESSKEKPTKSKKQI